MEKALWNKKFWIIMLLLGALMLSYTNAFARDGQRGRHETARWGHRRCHYYTARSYFPGIFWFFYRYSPRGCAIIRYAR